VANHEWRGSSPLEECYVSKVTCSPSFIYSLMRLGQVAKEAWKASFHVTPIALQVVSYLRLFSTFLEFFQASKSICPM